MSDHHHHHHSHIRVENPPKVSVGPKSVTNACKMILKAMPPWKAFKLLQKLNQKKGIDCPGCAWPDPEKRSKLGEFCENGVKAIAEEAQHKLADAAFFKHYTIDSLRKKSDYWLGQQGRLAQPMIKRPDNARYQPIEWDDAFQLIGQHLKGLDHPDRAVFYTSGRTSNEAAFLYQLFVRKLGTNNLPDCSNMCHESSGVALTETVGIGKGSVTLEDFEHAEVILIFGQNPGTNHPRMLNSLEKAKKKGAKIIVINPLKEVALLKFKNPQKIIGWTGSGTDIADLYLQIKINQDVALLKAWMKLLLEDEDGLDQVFIQEKTRDIEALKADLSSYSIDELIAQTGLAKEDVIESAEWLKSKSKIIACWAMGLTQHVNAVDNIREIVNLLLMKGSIGKPGAGTCPVRGHSNVQGDRTMGIWERPTKAWTDKLKETFNFTPPETPGYNVVESIEAMNKGKVSFFMALGGNLLPAAPDTLLTEQALKKCELTVHLSTKLNRTHLATGSTSLILPCLGRTDKHIQSGKEQMVTVENSMGMVHSSIGVLTPPSQALKSEPEIVASIASATLGDKDINWSSLVEDYDNIRDLIAKAIVGFEDYNARLRKDNGFELPNGARIGEFNTSSKKAHFTINKLAESIPEGHVYTMMTIRSHDQFNTTIYGNDDRYRGVFGGRNVVFMNEGDMKKEGLSKADTVELFNNYGIERRIVGFEVIPYDIPSGCLATYFPEANPLVPLHLFARKSHTPASKSVGVNVKKV
ncbi:FdhF/YdeP family oxidoreductase [Marinoscillum sp. MHG1-6]|uniref:FdhF/YdeP family oxidoreductase n=1 Tax=Marinoscillum sp. MHG1-6 TaxID=2959627 RepID=UPI00215818FB|nr:FdhF/YdeP family oxidoreductase [Marinoscillum sp. MHG1-6]